MDNTKKVIEENSGIRLDIGCGANKQPGFVGMDVRNLPGVDIVQDVEEFPWPLPDESVLVAFASHLVEHINPARGGFLKFMDEVWRIMKVGGEFAIVCPHGYSSGYLQDPTHCLPEGAEVLTEDGFKDMRDVKLGENILTLNLDDGKTEYSKCVNVIDEEYSGDMLEFKNRSMNIVVTPNHDLVWKTWYNIDGFHKSPAESFEQVGNFARRGYRSIRDWKGTNKENISEDWMELLGWILSEGSFQQKGNYGRVVIHQSVDANPEKHQRILNLLELLGFDYSVYVDRQIYINSQVLFDELNHLGRSHEKYIPGKYKNLPKTHLFRLLESLLLGDGEVHPSGKGHTYTTVSKRLAEDVQEIAIKCGMVSKITKRKGRSFVAPNRKEYTRKDQYRVSITQEKEFLYPSPERVHYDGRIVCVTVENNNTILTRYNGYVSWMGNCNALNETTWAYFTPVHPLWTIYKPKPWTIKHLSWNPAANIEVVLVKIKEEPNE